MVIRSYSVEGTMVPKEDAEDPELEKILDVIQNHKYFLGMGVHL